MFLLNIACVFGKTGLYRHIMAGILAFNISRDNKIGICPNYLRMSVNITQPEGFDLIPNMSHIREYGFKFTNMNNIFKIRGGSKGGAHPACPPPPKIGQNMIFLA